MGNASGLAGLLLLLGALSASPASAQMAGADGAFARLSPGHQKVAQALFTAQTIAPGQESRAKNKLTLDQIAAQKQGGQGWGQVFQTMRAQGLLQDKSLGQVVTRYESQRAGSARSVALEHK